MVAMNFYRELCGQPRDAYRGEFQPPIAEVREPVRVVSMRRSGNVVLLAIATGNHVDYWRLTAPDDPRLQTLGADDRNQVQALAIAIKREVANA